MGLLDSLESMASNQTEQGGNPQAKVAGGLMQALEEHPGGLAGVMQHMQQNGVDAQSVATNGTAAPGQVQQGLAGSGLIERVAEKAGVSPQMAEMALATVLPMAMSHFTQGGTTAAPQSGLGGMAGGLLSKFL